MKKLLIIAIVFFASLFQFSKQSNAFEYQGSMIKGGETYTDYFLFKNNNNQYAGIFYYASCYNGGQINNAGMDFKVICSPTGYVWYGTGCDANLENCGYENNFAPNQAYLTVFSDLTPNGRDGNYYLTYPFGNEEYCSSKDIYSSGGSRSLIIESDRPSPTLPIVPIDNLTIFIEPEGSGIVKVNGEPCADSCSYLVDSENNLSLEATPNQDYSFGYWTDTKNSFPLKMDENSEERLITAKFFRTFRNAAAEGFNQSNGHYGQCLSYVEYEIGEDICSGYAVNCFAQANIKGFATGDIPRVGAVVVFIKTSQMASGHVGIISAINQDALTMTIHDANWCTNKPENCEFVEEHDVDINRTDIVGYIYPVYEN